MAGLLTLLTVTALAAAPAYAQPRDNAIGVRGFATFGHITFQSQSSFDAIFDRHAGPIIGGGGQALLPWGIFVEVAASQFAQEGERAFVTATGDVFRLGIPVAVTITPLEITGGWRFRKWPRVVPYGGVGYSSYRYRETSDFADPDENVDERFAGFHIIGGAEYQPRRWLAVGGEVSWASIPDALGGGVSATFNEDNLGGTTLRLKISVGQ
ncbi:MAG TPA: outer membrane beta-barrel protein [Vicinamibacterales bacterium]|nr:outer membrane beta-barrel protein [Vicinamibacterales bacterium]